MRGPALALALLAALPAAAAERAIVLASTTSTEQSGLLDHILPLFREATGIEVRVVAQGTGQALRTAARGDADMVLVHDRESEERFVADGHGVERHEVMYNDYVLVGPSDDPAGVRGLGDAAMALARLAERELTFVSRGDDSGTHKAELRLWETAGIPPEGRWYRETGSGMGPTLNIAAAMDAYTLTDRGTWLSFANRQNLEILVEGDERLLNPYGVILVSPEPHPHVEAEAGRAFIDWLVSEAGQEAIASYRVQGEQLFFPSAGQGS
jgi:tungstate transport system substrate-binding protein